MPLIRRKNLYQKKLTHIKMSFFNEQVELQKKSEKDQKMI